MKFPALALAVAVFLCAEARAQDSTYRLQRPPLAPPIGAAAAGDFSGRGAVNAPLANFSDFNAAPVRSPAFDAASRQAPLASMQDFGSPPGGRTLSAGADYSSTQTMVRIPTRPPILQGNVDRPVTQLELNFLGKHDIVLIIDKSASMRTPDCPGGLSRWDWCGQQTLALARQTNGFLPKGITIELFSTGTKIFTNVDMNQVPDIFRAFSPGGITREATAVRKVLADYFIRRESSSGNVRPLIIAVITDGLPTNPEDLKDEIIRATHELRNPAEVRMTFLQVGCDPEGQNFVQTLDRFLVNEGAGYDIVASKTFPQLMRSGLTRALIDCISENGNSR